MNRPILTSDDIPYLTNQLGRCRVLARWLTEQCVRNNTDLEEWHATPQERISEAEMRDFMLQIENNLTGLLYALENIRRGKIAKGIKSRVGFSKFLTELKRAYFGEYGVSWDVPSKKWDEMKSSVDK